MAEKSVKSIVMRDDEMKKIEVASFKLYYDGIYTLTFEYKGEKYSVRPLLIPQQICKILENEEFSNSEDMWFNGFEFTKTTLILYCWEREDNSLSFLTSTQCEMNVFESLRSLIHCEIKGFDEELI